MKLPLFFFCVTSLFLKAELPSMTEDKSWLGYFTAWEEKYFDYGFGTDGEGIAHAIKRKERIGHFEFSIRCKVQEKIKGKWVSRKMAKEDGLTSESKGGLNPEKPVSILFRVSGGTKVEFIHAKSQGQIMIQPKILEKTTKNPVRAVVEIVIPNFYRFREEFTKRELKKKLRSDLFTAIRAEDGKKVKAKFYEIETDLLSEEFLEKGAREISFKTEKIDGRTFTVGQGGEKVGVLEIRSTKPLHKGMKILWIPDETQLAEKDCFVTFGVK